MRFIIPVLLVLSTGSLTACFDGGGGGGGGGDNTEYVYIEDASVGCDPTASAWDDLFIFEVLTSGPVDEVEVEIYKGSTNKGRRNLGEGASGNWYLEVWADDIGCDCDDWNSMSFDYTAYGDEDTDSAQVVP
jgi:hypothetical protein